MDRRSITIQVKKCGISLKLLELPDLEVLDLNVLDSDLLDFDVVDLEVSLFRGFSRTRPSSLCAALLKILIQSYRRV